MKMWEKGARVVCAAALAAVVTASCSRTESGGKSGQQDGKADMAPAAMKITVFQSDLGQEVPANPHDDPTFRYLMQKTNTDLNWVYLNHNDYGNQLKLRYASSDLPDVVCYWGIDGNLMQAGQVADLTDLIDKFGPHLKKNIPQSSWDAVTRNGRILGIPVAPNGNAPAGRILYVRKDWMDKVGIKEAPKTPDEFLDMLRAFRDKDPNGNGRPDELPFSAREGFTWMENVMGMFGANEFTPVVQNGEVVPGYVSQPFKQALGFIRGMVEEKLIDPDFLTNKRNIWEEKITGNLVGVWDHTTDLAWDWQDKLNKALPGQGADVIAIPTPKAPGVTHVGDVMVPISVVYTVSKEAKDPVAIVKFFDWLASDEGQQFAMFGVPGVTYTKDASGKIHYDAKRDSQDKTAIWRVNSFNMVSYNKDLYTILKGQQATEKEDLAYGIASKEGIPSPLLDAPTFAFESGHPDLTVNGDMWKQAASRIVLGDKPLDYFDQFVKEWRAAGGDQIIKEETEWYKANRKEP